jgi:GT2 family glycosyltransferase
LDERPLPASPAASIVITSRNRRDEVLRAVASSFAQISTAVEVLVYDDASEDGTAEAIRRLWPACRVFESDTRVGYIVNRNRGFTDAQAPVVFSLDDDAYFTRPDTVAKTLMAFERDPNLFAVAIPYIEPLNRRSQSTLDVPCTATEGQRLRSFVGCAHAIRRAIALGLGGYRELYVHQGEERDLCLRALDRGFVVVYGGYGPVTHMVSGARDTRRVTYFALRNQLLFNWLNLPLGAMIVRMLWDPVAMLRYRFSWSDLPHRVTAILAGLAECVRRAGSRRPVSRQAYRQFRDLPSHGPEPFDGEVPAAIGVTEPAIP